MPSFAVTPNQRARIGLLILDNTAFKISGLEDVRAFNKMKTGLKLTRMLVLLAGGKPLAGDYLSKGPPSVFELEEVAVNFLLNKILATISAGPILAVLAPLVDAIDAYKAGTPMSTDGLGTIDVEAEPWAAPEDDPTVMAIAALREVAAMVDADTLAAAVSHNDADVLNKARKAVEALDAREAQILAANQKR